MKASRVLLCLPALFFSISAQARPQAVPDATWPMYQYRSDHNAVFSSPAWSASWRTDFGDQVNGSLSVVGSTIYVESFDKHLYAIDAPTGRIRWSSPLSDIAMNTPLVDNGRVIISTGSNAGYPDPSNPLILVGGRGAGNDVTAFSQDDGSKIWSTPTIGSAMPTGVLTNAPDSLLVFATGDKHTYAAAADTGKIVWTVPVLGSDAMSSLAEDHGVVFGSTGWGLFWPIMLQAYDRRDTALMNASGWTWALRPSDGQISWISPHGRGLGSPTVGDGIVFEESEQFSGWYGKPQFLVSEIDALDEVTGRLRWSYVSPAGSFSAAGSGLEDIGGVFWQHRFYDALPFARTFAAFDAKKGKMAWEIHTKDQVKMSPLIYGDKILFGDTTGELYIARVADGSLVQTVAFPDIFTCSSPLIVNDTLFITNGRSLYALNLPALERGSISAPVPNKRS